MAASAQPALIWLVADDPLWRDQLYGALQQEGYRVHQQPLPPQLKALKPEQSDAQSAALWVVNLPSERHDLTNTLALIHRLRRRDPLTPLLLLADAASDDQRAQLLEIGADDVMARPFGLREFVARCRAILRRVKRLQCRSTADQVGVVLRAGSIELYRDQCRVCVDGIEVLFTPREFRLLECFMLQPGRALSRDQLIEQVWGDDYNGNNKSVDVHVWWLRKKLNRPSQPSLFVTVRGIGYRFVVPGR
jgi:two-component system phosphate regulon response regulator PhoB